jgi:hypothetical protein
MGPITIKWNTPSTTRRDVVTIKKMRQSSTCKSLCHDWCVKELNLFNPIQISRLVHLGQMIWLWSLFCIAKKIETRQKQKPLKLWPMKKPKKKLNWNNFSLNQFGREKNQTEPKLVGLNLFSVRLVQKLEKKIILIWLFILIQNWTELKMLSSNIYI